MVQPSLFRTEVAHVQGCPVLLNSELKCGIDGWEMQEVLLGATSLWPELSWKYQEFRCQISGASYQDS